MASKRLNDQTEWLANKLLHIRYEIDGRHSPYTFDANLPENYTEEPFEEEIHTDKIMLTIRLLLEIIGDIKEITKDEVITYQNNNDGTFVFQNLTSKLLRLYIRKKYNKTPSLFKEARDHKNRNVLTYLNKPTEITLGKNELAVFRLLFKNHDSFVSYVDLNQAIKSARVVVDRRHIPTHRDTDIMNAKEMASIHSAVKALRVKMKRATGSETYAEIIASETNVGYKMIS
jgi:hypothetical protein